jgi:hypothetical protein
MVDSRDPALFLRPSITPIDEHLVLYRMVLFLRWTSNKLTEHELGI